jgi:hypothetical protein
MGAFLDRYARFPFALSHAIRARFRCVETVFGDN